MHLPRYAAVVVPDINGTVRQGNVCPVCGAVMDRDWNSAENIRMEGLRIYHDKYNKAA